MGLIDHVAAVFKSSSEDAEMIGETTSLIRHMEDELRFLSKNDPQQFAALTREQYVIIVQSIILKKHHSYPMKRECSVLHRLAGCMTV